jgi:hypothetical protein
MAPPASVVSRRRQDLPTTEMGLNDAADEPRLSHLRTRQGMGKLPDRCDSWS